MKSHEELQEALGRLRNAAFEAELAVDALRDQEREEQQALEEIRREFSVPLHLKIEEWVRKLVDENSQLRTRLESFRDAPR